MMVLIRFIFMACLWSTASAQDTLYLVTGKKAVVHIIETGPDTVIFTLNRDTGTSQTHIPTSRIHKIIFSSGDSLKWENNFDVFDPSIDKDSAFAKKLGISKEAYIRKKEVMKRQENFWEKFWGCFALFWLVPW